MKISDLTRLTGVTVATIKYYVREGLLPAGRPVSATQAEYGRVHVDRLRLIRALVDVGGLSLTVVREVLATLDADGPGARSTGPADIAAAVTAAHRALSAGSPRAGAPHQARAVVESLGWRVDPDSPALHQLEAALAGLDAVGLPPGHGTLQTYAEAALRVAEADLRSIPPSRPPATTVRFVVVETVLYEPVLLALRRLAQQHVYSSGESAGESAGPVAGPVAAPAPATPRRRPRR